MEHLAEPLVGTPRKPTQYASRVPQTLLGFLGFLAAACFVTVLIATTKLDSVQFRDVNRVASALFTIVLLALGLLWNQRSGWLCVPYALSAVLGLVLDMLSNELLLQPLTFDVDYLAALLRLLSASALSFAFWSPSVKTSYLNDASVDVAWGADASRAARIPIHPFRLLPCLGFVAALIALWHVSSWPTSAARPVYTPALCFVAVMTLMVWRAASRIGYRVPSNSVVPTGASAAVTTSSQHGGGASTPANAASPTSSPRLSPGRSRHLPQQSRRRRTQPHGSPSQSPSPSPSPSPSSRGARAGAGAGSGAGGAVPLTSILRTPPVRPMNGSSSAVPPLSGVDTAASTSLAAMGKPEDNWLGDSEVIESVGWQCVGLFGALLLVTSWSFSSYIRFWRPTRGHTPCFMLFLAALLDLLAQFCILCAIPCKIPPRGSLHDPRVRPRPFDGAPMRVLIPLPDVGFDVTQAAVVWFYLRRRGHEVLIATQSGNPPVPDPVSRSGVSRVSGGVTPLVMDMYEEMMADASLRNPLRWTEIDPEAFHGVLLLGGSSAHMEPFLSAPVLQQRMAAYWELDRPVGAIGSGMLVLARSRHRGSGVSLLNGCIGTTFPSFLEKCTSAGMILCCRRCGGSAQLANDGSVQDEVERALGESGRLFRGPVNFEWGAPWDDQDAFVVEDGKLVSGRWGGDAFLFARRFVSKLEEVHRLF